MATVRKLKHEPQFKNYLSVLTGLHTTGECLATFTENGLDSIHQQITATLGNLPRCYQNCSQVINDTQRWCPTCTLWQQELLRFITFPRQVVWKKMHSGDWPNGLADIAEVFVPSGWSNTGINLHDLSTQMNVWINCTKFQNLSQLAKDLRKERNAIAHGSPKLTNNEKMKAFQSIENVLIVPDVVQTIPNYQEVLQTITDLKQNDLYQHETDMAVAVAGILDAINKGNIAHKFETYKLNKDFRKLQKQIHNSSSWKSKLTWSGLVLAGLTVVIASLAYQFGLHQEGKAGKDIQHEAIFEEGCLSEITHPLVKRGMNMSGYLLHHKHLIGRELVLAKIENNIFKSSKSKGLIISAEMGYGKTALVAHIICATKQQKAKTKSLPPLPF